MSPCHQNNRNRLIGQLHTWARTLRRPIDHLLGALFSRPPRPITHDQAVFVCGMSRSGTTLLAAAMDAHPRLAMGYELIPPPLSGPDELLQALDQALDRADGDFRLAGGQYRRAGEDQMGLFLARCHRVGLTPDQLRHAVHAWTRETPGPAHTFPSRLALAWSIVREKQDLSSADMAGFKLDPGHISLAGRLFPRSSYVGILRDPRDVLLSHRDRGFNSSPAQILETWNRVERHLRQARSRRPQRCYILRYEDLVRDPASELKGVFEALDLPMDSAVLHFEESNASVLHSRHPNVHRLREGFTTDRVGRWVSELPEDLSRQAWKTCRAGIRRWSYPR
jgi:hypothetical protein